MKNEKTTFQLLVKVDCQNSCLKRRVTECKQREDRYHSKQKGQYKLKRRDLKGESIKAAQSFWVRSTLKSILAVNKQSIIRNPSPVTTIHGLRANNEKPRGLWPNGIRSALRCEETTEGQEFNPLPLPRR